MRLGGIVSPDCRLRWPLLAASTAGIVSAWARGLRIDCGCVGGGELAAGQFPDYWLESGRDLVSLAAAVVLLWWARTRGSLDGWPPART